MTKQNSNFNVADLKPMDYKMLDIEYSDDISCLVSAKGDRKLQPAIDKIMTRYEHYFSVNGLAMNPTKSSLICFRYGEPTCKLKVNGNKEKKTLKFLGVTFDSNYTFQTHFKHPQDSHQISIIHGHFC